MSIKPKIEAALAATAERLSPGSGESTVHHHKNDISTIEATSDDYGKRYADEEVRLAAPVIVEAKHPEGDPVTFKKHHDGVIIVFAGSFIYVRGMGFAVRDVKGFRNDEVSVESVTTIVDGAEIPGLRITGPSGRPTLALAIAQTKESSDPAAQAAVRDELVGLLTS